MVCGGPAVSVPPPVSVTLKPSAMVATTWALEAGELVELCTLIVQVPSSPMVREVDSEEKLISSCLIVILEEFAVTVIAPPPYTTVICI